MLQENEIEVINLMIDHKMSEALAVRASEMRSAAIDKLIQYLKETDTTDKEEIIKLMNKAGGYPENTIWFV